VVIVIDGLVGRADVGRLCERVRVLLDGTDAHVVVCDVGRLTRADASAIDALARMHLTARRLGSRLRLRHASTELQELLTLAGLDEVLLPE
jgi:anti-anti-sigma regulatory factor